MELNLATEIPKVGRFRVNVFRQIGGIGLVARHVKDVIPSFTELGLPRQFKEYISAQRGLVLFVGGAGTGKSTSLASMLSYRARTMPGHILTVEDPIEFIHTHQKSIVNQREVGQDTHSYEAALSNALREAPDVIMIGEIRDTKTMRHALSYAESGHLCVATLHANNARYALSRIINFFPPHAHSQIFLDLSLYLKAIVSQRLVIGVDGKRIAAFERMANTPYISELIRDGKLSKLRDAMERDNQSELRTFDDDMYHLCQKGRITQEEALRNADSSHNLLLKLKNMPNQ